MKCFKNQLFSLLKYNLQLNTESELLSYLSSLNYTGIIVAVVVSDTPSDFTSFYSSNKLVTARKPDCDSP